MRSLQDSSVLHLFESNTSLFFFITNEINNLSEKLNLKKKNVHEFLGI